MKKTKSLTLIELIIVIAIIGIAIASTIALLLPELGYNDGY